MQNARKLKDWLVVWCFGASFHLNETTRFKQNNAVSCGFQKKKEKNETVSFWGGTVSSSSSPRRAAGEEKFCFLPLVSSSHVP